MDITKTISTEYDNLRRRIVKVLRFGKTDARTAKEAAPYGTDSNPIKGMTAVYSQTSNKKDRVIIGYINKNGLAASGEHRTFSTDDDGVVKFFIWQKKDGTCEIGGNSDFMVRFNALKSGFDQLRQDFNTHVHTGVQTGGGSSGVPATPSSASIDNAKIEQIKTL